MHPNIYTHMDGWMDGQRKKERKKESIVYCILVAKLLCSENNVNSLLCYVCIIMNFNNS
jgi:hypothetical protein